MSSLGMEWPVDKSKLGIHTLARHRPRVMEDKFKWDSGINPEGGGDVTGPDSSGNLDFVVFQGVDGKHLRGVGGALTQGGDMLYRLNSANVATPALGASATDSQHYYSQVSALTIDGDPNTSWWNGPGNAVGQWVQIDLGSSKIITGYYLDQHTDRNHAYTIQASTDGTTFADIFVRTDADLIESFNFDTPTNARYWRFLVVEDGSWGGQFNEIYLYQDIAPLSRLPIGSENQVLTVDSGLPSWQDIPDPPVGMVRNGSTANGNLAIWDGSNVDSLKDGGPVPIGGGGGGGIAFPDDYILIQDQKPQGTNGGTFANGVWKTRDLTVEVADSGAYASLTANQITLQAGTYRARILCPSYNVASNQARLQNITDGTTTFLGTSNYSGYGSGTGGVYVVHGISEIIGEFTITSPKVFEVQHICNATQASTGLGVAGNFSVEIYTSTEFWRKKDAGIVPTGGSSTLTAGTMTTVTDTNAKTTSVIILQPTCSVMPALGCYISAKASGSFEITHLTAAGTETFDYEIINP